MKAESERQGRLDSKANGLLAIVGLSLTVLFTYGGQILLGHAKVLREQEGLVIWVVAVAALILAVVAALAASAYALAALFVARQFLTMNERTIFKVDTLRKADDEDEADAGVAQYRRYLIVDMWQIVQTQFHNLERKARFIRRGQAAYGAFLLLLFAIGMIMAVFTWRGTDEVTKPTTAPSANAAPPASGPTPGAVVPPRP
jgi:hypothetical protein